MHFSDNLIYLRELNNLSRRDLSSRLGYKSPSSIQKWEKGGSVPPMDTLVLLSELFGVPIDDLLGKDLRKDGVGIGKVADFETTFDHFDKELTKSYHESPSNIRRIVRVALNIKRERPNKKPPQGKKSKKGRK